MSGLVVRAPASSANLGAGFDVFGMALSLPADVGDGDAPDGAQQVDEHHPAHVAFERCGGSGPIWLRCSIPMARGLGFSGAVRVAAAGLGVAQRGDDLAGAAAEILSVTAELEGHGDNVAASVAGGVVAYVDGVAVPFPLGPVLGAAAFVAWVPDVTTSTDASRRALADQVARGDAVANIAAAAAFTLAFAHDDPTLLAAGTRDHLHQGVRVPPIPGAVDALDAGVAAGAWAGWLSGSGPTVGLLGPAERADAIADSMPAGGHTKVLGIDRLGVRVV